MWIIGLTGGIGAGKSTLAKHLKQIGIPVHSADQAIHSLFETDDEIQKQIRNMWPDVFVKGEIDRLLLRKRALSSPFGLSYLERILYPRLAEEQRKFLLRYQKLKVRFVALDVPLLFEVGLDRFCDVVILASSPSRIRKKRVLKRKGMTPAQFKTFENSQMTEGERKKRADFVIQCGRDKGSALKRIQEILTLLSQKSDYPWNGRWPMDFKKELYDQRNRFRHRNNRI